MAETTLVLPLSTSVSLVSTLPLAPWPVVPLAVPPASVAQPTSSVATGASLAPLTVTVRVVVEKLPPLSVMR